MMPTELLNKRICREQNYIQKSTDANPNQGVSNMDTLYSIKNISLTTPIHVNKCLIIISKLLYDVISFHFEIIVYLKKGKVQIKEYTIQQKT